MKNTKYYSLLDIFKFIFCIMIVAIHTNLLCDFSDDINWYVTHLIFRLAVPFFFITSGFLYGSKILKKDSDIGLITNKYLIRLFVPLIFWLIMGFIPEIIKRDYNVVLTIKELYKNILVYPYGALWYIYALIVSIPILSLFYKKGRFILPIIIGFFLYIFALLGNSYYFVTLKIPALKRIMDLYIEKFISTRNGIFVGILFVSLGVYIAKIINTKKINMKLVIISFILLYSFFLFEVIFVKNKIYIDDNSLFISLPFLVSLLVVIFIKCSKNKQYMTLRNLSGGVYFMHRVVLEYLLILFTFNSYKKLFVITLSITLIVTYLLQKLNNKYINKILT